MASLGHIPPNRHGKATASEESLQAEYPMEQEEEQMSARPGDSIDPRKVRFEPGEMLWIYLPVESEDPELDRDFATTLAHMVRETNPTVPVLLIPNWLGVVKLEGNEAIRRLLLDYRMIRQALRALGYQLPVAAEDFDSGHPDQDQGYWSKPGGQEPT